MAKKKPESDAQVEVELRRCPNCGASDVSLDTTQGKLKCNYCRHVFEPQKNNAFGGVESLNGEKVDAGAEDIVPSEDVIITLKCPSCGAEAVVNASENLQVDCHWCRHVLTLENKIPNGAVPDFVLPFSIPHDEAVERMRKYIAEYSNANLEFKSDFTPEHVKGVYFPYFVVDVRAVYTAFGDGEKTASGSKNPPFKVDTYEVKREFDLFVDDLTVESSTNRLNQDTFVNSNNVINAILPFDTENAVAWDPSYLRGFSSEKRDANRRAVKEVVALQAGDVGRQKMRESIAEYDRGLHWHREHLGIKGTKWRSAYLPVWIFSYRRPEETGDKRIYYVAMNGRTGEVVGDIPLGNAEKNKEKTLLESTVRAFVISCIAVIVLMVVAIAGKHTVLSVLVIMYASISLPIWVFGMVMCGLSKKYKINYPKTVLRSSGGAERHTHENETESHIENMQKSDRFVVSRNGVWTSEISGRNDARAIVSLSSGRNSMNLSERGRFAMGGNYSHVASLASGMKNRYVRPTVKQSSKARNHGNFVGTIVLICFILVILMAIMGGTSGGSYRTSSSGYDSGYSSYDYDYDYDYDSGSSYDYDYDYDSGSSYDYDYDSGFDYSYDY